VCRRVLCSLPGFRALGVANLSVRVRARDGAVYAVIIKRLYRLERERIGRPPAPAATYRGDNGHLSRYLRDNGVYRVVYDGGDAHDGRHRFVRKANWLSGLEKYDRPETLAYIIKASCFVPRVFFSCLRAPGRRQRDTQSYASRGFPKRAIVQGRIIKTMRMCIFFYRIFLIPLTKSKHCLCRVNRVFVFFQDLQAFIYISLHAPFVGAGETTRPSRHEQRERVVWGSCFVSCRRVDEYVLQSGRPCKVKLWKPCDSLSREPGTPCRSRTPTVVPKKIRG